jgi:hypothetical protein
LPVHAVSIAKESEEPETTVRQHSAPLVEPPATPVVHVQPAEPQTGSLIGSDRAIAPSLSGANTTNRSAYTVYDSRRRSRTGEVIKEPDGLRITMLGYDPDFRGGQHIELKAIVTRISEGVEEPLVGALISVKILGTTFRPVLFSLKTDREGLMNVSTRIPAFASGRAAIVVKAATGDLVTEARWVVHPGK